MAQHVSEDEVKLVIDAESAKAQQEVYKMQQASKSLREENKSRLKQMLDLEKAGQKESAYYKNLQTEYSKTSKKINEYNKQIAEQTAKINVNHKSMAQLKKEASLLRRQLDNTVKSLNPEEYERLEERLKKVTSRMAELKQSAKSVEESLVSDQTIGFLLGTLAVRLADFFAGVLKSVKNFIGETINECTELARSSDGVTHAFNNLNRPDILDNLRKATKGTVNDIELMKATLQAKDFRIPLEDMGKYLQFAQLKAQQTGQSVEYMTNSIVTGLGRKSVMILDNLGISASEVNERTKQMGSFMKAVASIVDEELAAAGETYVSAADRMAQRTVRLQNAQKELGDELLPLREKYEDAYGSMQITTVELMKWMVKHRDIVAALTVAVVGLTVATAAQSATLKSNIVVTKTAAAASLMYRNVLTSLKGISLLVIAGYAKMNAYITGSAIATTRATAAMRLFNIACKANLIGLVVTGLVAAITYFGLFSSSADKATKKTNELSDAEQHLKSVRTEADGQLKKDIATLKNFTGTKKQEIELVKQMNSRYGESIGYYKTVSEWYDALIKNSKLYCDQMVIEAQTRQIANQIAELEEQKHQIRYDDKGNKKKYSNYGKVHLYMNGKSEVEQSEAAKAQAKYNDLDAQSRAQRSRLDELEKKRLANAKKIHTGADVDPYANTSKGGKGGSNTKDDSKAIDDFKRARQAELDIQKRIYEEQLIVLKRSLAERKITREEYDTQALAAEIAYKDNVLKVEQDYQDQSQQLVIKDAQKKKDIQDDQRRNTAKAMADADQAMEQAYIRHQDRMQKMMEAALSPAQKEKMDRDAQLKVLEAYYNASMEYAKENGESVMSIVTAYALAISNLKKQWADADKEKHFRARSSAGLTTVQEEHEHTLSDIDSNTELSPEERDEARLNAEREYQERLLQVRQEYGLVKQQELYDQELEQLRLAKEQGYLTEEEYEKAKTQMKMDQYKQQFDYYKELFSNAVNALQDAELANVEAKYDAEIDAAKKAGKDTSKLEEKAAEEKLKIQKKYADVQFAIRASEIIADTAQAIIATHKSLGGWTPWAIAAAALMGVTGAAQLAVAAAERNKVKSMTLKGSSGSSSTTGARIATGKEEGGFLDVEREQDGKRFHAKYDPNRRGYVDRPTVIVGEGPAGQSKEWIASNAAVENPTVRPILDILDRHQRAGSVRTLDLNKYLLQQRGYAQGGSIANTPLPSSAGTGISPELMERFVGVMERMERDGIPAILGLDEIDAKNKLRSKSRDIGSK